MNYFHAISTQIHQKKRLQDKSEIYPFWRPPLLRHVCLDGPKFLIEKQLEKTIDMERLLHAVFFFFFFFWFVFWAMFLDLFGSFYWYFVDIYIGYFGLKNTCVLSLSVIECKSIFMKYNLLCIFNVIWLSCRKSFLRTNKVQISLSKE